MAQFLYTAMTDAGARVSGSLEADSEAGAVAAVERLSEAVLMACGAPGR